MPAASIVISDRRYDGMTNTYYTASDLARVYRCRISGGNVNIVGNDQSPGVFAAMNDAAKPGERDEPGDRVPASDREAGTVKVRRTAPSDAKLLRDLVAAVARIEQRQTVQEQVALRVVDMLAIHDEKLDAILEAATREPGPSPVARCPGGHPVIAARAGNPVGRAAGHAGRNPSATNGRASRTWTMNRTRRIRRWSPPGRASSMTRTNARH